MNINDLINQFVEAKAEREALTAQAAALTKKLARIEADIMEQMGTAGLTQAASDKASCTMRKATHPAITDWDAFYKHVAATGHFELLHKRLSSGAFHERWEANEVIPGVTSVTQFELSVRRK